MGFNARRSPAPSVDEVTQFEVVATVERISEAYLIPVLQTLLADFPFVIRGFHVPARGLCPGRR